MNAFAATSRFEAERRTLADRRRVCLLQFADEPASDRRTGFDRRDILKIRCHGCQRPLFGVRDADRRLALSPYYLEYMRDHHIGKQYLCPHCGVRYERLALQAEQDSLMLRRVPEE